MDSEKILHLPPFLGFTVLALLGLVGVVAFGSAAYYFFAADPASDRVISLMAVTQTALGAAVVVLLVVFSEKSLSTNRLNKKTDEFLGEHLPESLRRIELPQVRKDATVNVVELTRPNLVHGRRKDIYGINYELALDNFRMKMWVGINVKRLSVIYFVPASDPSTAQTCQEAFKFTFGGAEKVGYSTNFEFAEVDGERLVSIWSTVMAEQAVLGRPAEQLFWAQDIAMMTQSVARTALRQNIGLLTRVDPGPL